MTNTSTAGNIYTQTYTYRDIGTNKTTPQIVKLAYSGFTGAPSYSYTYDALGNIATYTQGGKTYTYSYDKLNQLTGAVEKDSNGNTTKTWSYTYDLGGNLLTSGDGTTTHTYTYGDAQWADLLTAFDGHAITYDASGNPLTYYNGQSYTFTWSEGRRLAKTTVGGSTVSYVYDMDGLRVSKTVNGVTHTYTYASGKLLRETYGSNTLDFFYDQNGRPYALKYNGATYYYITNLQGDVLYLLDSAKNVAATYTYDPYGKVLTATGAMANINPLRYRGYYYDSETSLYYLQSRYYDPATCRFINADAYASTGQGILGHNMFAYCGNNAANMIDSYGDLAKFLQYIVDGLAQLAKTVVGDLWYIMEYNRKGELYEHWVTSDGKPIHSRHHSNHGNKNTHPLVPHDHEWHDDDDGNWTQDHKSLPPDSGFQAPEKGDEDNATEKVVGAAVGTIGIVAVGYGIYTGVKWTIAAIVAPFTSGISLGVAGVMP